MLLVREINNASTLSFLVSLRMPLAGSRSCDPGVPKHSLPWTGRSCGHNAVGASPAAAGPGVWFAASETPWSEAPLSGSLLLGYWHQYWNSPQNTCMSNLHLCSQHEEICYLELGRWLGGKRNVLHKREGLSLNPPDAGCTVQVTVITVLLWVGGGRADRRKLKTKVCNFFWIIRYWFMLQAGSACARGDLHGVSYTVNLGYSNYGEFLWTHTGFHWGTSGLKPPPTPWQPISLVQYFSTEETTGSIVFFKPSNQYSSEVLRLPTTCTAKKNLGRQDDLWDPG